MRLSQIKSELVPFEALIETIPNDHIQGIKISGILLLKIDEPFQELAVKDERIDYLTTELFGKNKNKEDPDSDDILARLDNDHLMSDLDALLPWNWSKDDSHPKIISTNQNVEQEYPKELLIKRLGPGQNLF